MRLYQEILGKKYYWKGMLEECKNYVIECIIYLKQREGKKFNLCPKNIITKGAKERYVADGWKLHPKLCEKTVY